MDTGMQNKTDRTIGYIARDRIVADDPWFYSRLMARFEREEESVQGRRIHAGFYRFKPLLIGMSLLITVAVGTGIGRLMSPEKPTAERDILTGFPDSDVSAALFQEVSGTFNEQILLMK